MEINCSNCGKLIIFDHSKYPPQILSISCPSCKNKISYDNRIKEDLVPIPSDLLKSLPPLKEKSAIIIYEKENYLGIIKKGIEALGFNLKRSFKISEDPSNFILNELPSLIIYQVENLPPPPFKGLEPVLLIPINLRRHIFVAVISSNVKSLDGNSAFLYQVNLLISTKDIELFHHHIANALIYEYNLKANFKKIV